MFGFGLLGKIAHSLGHKPPGFGAVAKGVGQVAGTLGLPRGGAKTQPMPMQAAPAMPMAAATGYPAMGVDPMAMGMGGMASGVAQASRGPVFDALMQRSMMEEQ